MSSHIDCNFYIQSFVFVPFLPVVTEFFGVVVTDNKSVLWELFVEAFWFSAIHVEIEGLDGYEQGAQRERAEKGAHFCGFPMEKWIAKISKRQLDVGHFRVYWKLLFAAST